jgi:monoamine oxidase
VSRALSTALYFEGRHRSDAEVFAAFARLAPRLARDVAQLSPRVSRVLNNQTDRRFDRMSIAQYLDSLDMEPWLRALIEVAYVTVYGLDAAEQSSINFLSLIGTDLTDGLSLFGASDERYKVRDGADSIIRRLARPLEDHLQLDHRLVRLARCGAGYRLSLQTNGHTKEVDADAVVLALPFTMLRQVELGDILPPFKLRSIRELGYGTNSKLMVGLRRRLWRQQGFEGGVYTDIGLQSGWDSSRLRDGETGVFTYFMGGRVGVDIGIGSESGQAHRLSELTECIYPGFQALRTGSALRIHWPTQPWVLGSYTCYRTGQWTTIGSDESTPVDGIYFAGEHCDTAAQGYMNGGRTHWAAGCPDDPGAGGVA